MTQSPNSRPSVASSTSLLPPTDYLRVYEIFRERIVQEDNLINHRMTWMIFSEAIILALWGAITSQDMLEKACHATPPTHRIYYIMLILCIVGVAFAVASLITIQAARSEIEYITDEIYGKQYKFIADDNRIPRLTGAQGRHSIWSGHIMSWGVPLLFALMWLYFACDVLTTHC